MSHRRHAERRHIYEPPPAMSETLLTPTPPSAERRADAAEPRRADTSTPLRRAERRHAEPRRAMSLRRHFTPYAIYADVWFHADIITPSRRRHAATFTPHLSADAAIYAERHATPTLFHA